MVEEMGGEGVAEGMGGGETVLTTGVGVVEDSLVAWDVAAVVDGCKIQNKVNCNL